VHFFQQAVLVHTAAGDKEVLEMGAALSEALHNALLHGNLEIGSQLRDEDLRRYLRTLRERRKMSPYRERRIHLRATVSAEAAVFTLRDEGPGFDPQTIPDPTDPRNLLHPSGRGVFLMRAFMDDVRFNAAGNEVTLKKRFSGRATGSN
jgi:anti-sigma regulatory factor (Ser/Thr protein kinase)